MDRVRNPGAGARVRGRAEVSDRGRQEVALHQADHVVWVARHQARLQESDGGDCDVRLHVAGQARHRFRCAVPEHKRPGGEGQRVGAYRNGNTRLI